ncbi:spore germination protein [Bacillus sp. F19]|nr:spore germination protein [Bacillus sp. F19]
MGIVSQRELVPAPTLISVLAVPFQWVNILPLVKPDWKTVLDTIFLTKITFPFGELAVFLMIFPFVNNQMFLLRWMAILLIVILLIKTRVNNKKNKNAAV